MFSRQVPLCGFAPWEWTTTKMHHHTATQIAWLPWRAKAGKNYMFLLLCSPVYMRNHCLNDTIDNNLLVQILALSQPKPRAGIARHAPITTRWQRNCAHLGTIGHAGTLKLLLEEPAVECPQPFEDCGIIKICSKSFLGKQIYFWRCVTKSDDVI